MPNSSGPAVIIVGAGIGGLSLAVALGRAGHQPLVLERAPKLEAIGAGLMLFPNAMSGLESMGVAGAVRAAGAAAVHSAILSARGRVLATETAADLKGSVAVHRADLQTALLSAAGDLGVEVRAGSEVTSVGQTEREVIVRAADGSERRGQLLVGADGVWSAARDSVAPARPSYAGYTAWRGVSPARIKPGHMTESWGTGERFGLVDIGTRTYWFATANTRQGSTDPPGGRKADLIRRFADWHADIPGILDATPDDAILRNDVYYLRPLPRWSRGRVVLLGDAAHAVTPGIGQGAGQAIEDAVVLARQLAVADVPGDHARLREALARYESVRRPRAELTLKLSLRADRAAQLASPAGVRFRDFAVAHAPSGLLTAGMRRLVRTQPLPEGQEART